MGWGAAIQAIILAFCTWYMRSGSRRDADHVVRSTAAQSTSNDILERVKAVEADVALVKSLALKEAVGLLDDRGPSKPKEKP